MNSMIFQGTVSHARFHPVEHNFHYPVYFYAFDLDELSELARTNPLFGYNRFRPVAIHDKDYLQPGDEPIRQKLNRLLAESGVAAVVTKVILVTSARYFNYVFNPVSFFYCYAEDQKLICIVAQVNNTFGEMHIYLLNRTGPESVSQRLIFNQDKQFHVSPFFSRAGYYQFQLTEPGPQLDNQLDLYQHDQLMLIARMQGKSEPLTTRALLTTLLKSPLNATLTMPRILWQAAKLYWKKKLPVYTKPVPDHAMTIRPVPPTLIDRCGKISASRHLSRLQQGRLLIHLPEGEQLIFGRESEELKQITVKENCFFRRVMLAGEIGFGEAYTDGDWTTADLPGLLTLLARNEELVDDRSLLSATLGRWANYLRHQLRANTIVGSSRNIREHYDLSNDFFATFLDPSMTYSSALFSAVDEDLEQAQRNKIKEIITKAQISKDDHVLEIGCGWGSFAIEAVRQSGCRVTGITLSHEQLQLARQRVREAGLEAQIELKICDYRHVEGRYDKIVSIEMLEAVGHAGLKPFFRACDKALKPGGRAVIQVITIPDRKYTAYRYSSDWIRKHIFPGGHLPSLGALATAMASSSLNLSRLDQYGLDYARTLKLWRQTLLEKRKEILALGYDERFLRKWDYYFSYCQAGFSTRIIDLAQLVLDKPQQH